MDRNASRSTARRRGLVALVAASLMLLATACQTGSAQPVVSDASSVPSPPAGPWTYTDDRPETLSAEQAPTRIIAYEEDAAALMDMGIRPVAIFGSAPLDDNIYLEGRDLTGIESVGDVWGEVDIEKVASLSPDLIVSSFWASQQSGGGWGFGSKKQFESLSKLAPIVAIDSGTSAKTTTERYVELAETLGVDPDSPEMAEQKAAYDEAMARIAKVAEEHPDLTVLSVAAYPKDQVYVANPGTFPDLVNLRDEGGLNLMEPEKLNDNIWEYVSWEEIPKYQPDVLLVDQRNGAPSFEQLDKVPTWRQLEAAKAGQVIAWSVPSVESFQTQADRINAIADQLEQMQDIT